MWTRTPSTLVVGSLLCWLGLANAGSDTASSKWSDPWPMVECPAMTYTGGLNHTGVVDQVAWALQNPEEVHLRQPRAQWLPAHAPSGIVIECATAVVPLDYARNDSQSIEIFVKRLRHRDRVPSRALWLLSGGPGDASSDDVEPLHMILFDRLLRDSSIAFEVFVTDHRGVGRSTRLGCRRSQAETPGSPGGIHITTEEYSGCLRDLALDYPNDLSHSFSTENAAHDVRFLAEAFRRPGQLIEVYGISYGTYWAGRYLRLYPHHAHAVVLDGVVSASGRNPDQRLTFEKWDLKLDRVGRGILQRCGEDKLCSSKLGSDPWQFAKDTFTKLISGHCGQSLKHLGGIANLKRILGGLLYGWSARGVITALLYRLSRCSADDMHALAHFASLRSNLSAWFPIVPEHGSMPTGVPLRSEMLFRNVMLSELWDSSASDENMQDWFNMSMFGMNTFSDMPRLRVSWPVYDPGTHFNTTLSTATHLLFMNGDTDCQTPIWSALWEFETTSTSGVKDMIIWKDATHFSIFNTPTLDNGDPCGLQAVVAFLLEPAQRTWQNLTCRNKLEAISFASDEHSNNLLWGCPDAYDCGKQFTVV